MGIKKMSEEEARRLFWKYRTNENMVLGYIDFNLFALKEIGDKVVCLPETYREILVEAYFVESEDLSREEKQKLLKVYEAMIENSYLFESYIRNQDLLS